MDQEHRHPRPVLRAVEDLADLEARRIEGEPRLGEGGGPPGGAVVAVDGGRLGEAGEGEEGLAARLVALEAAGAADAGQADRAGAARRRG